MKKRASDRGPRSWPLGARARLHEQAGRDRSARLHHGRPRPAARLRRTSATPAPVQIHDDQPREPPQEPDASRIPQGSPTRRSTATRSPSAAPTAARACRRSRPSGPASSSRRAARRRSPTSRSCTPPTSSSRPFDQLLPFNGGIDRETGETEIDTTFDITFFGTTVSGHRVQSETASGILCSSCVGCFWAREHRSVTGGSHAPDRHHPDRSRARRGRTWSARPTRRRPPSPGGGGGTDRRERASDPALHEQRRTRRRARAR